MTERPLASLRFLIGSSLTWVGLSMLYDGFNSLVLPASLTQWTNRGTQASLLGIISFLGLLAGMLVQPVAGALSDRWRHSWGRSRLIGLGLLLALVCLAIFGLAPSLGVMIGAYICLQVAASTAQAGQQGLLPDLIPAKQRGMASGLKGFMDIGGAMLGFLVLGQLLGDGKSGVALAAIGAVLLATFATSLILLPEDRHPGQPLSVEGGPNRLSVRNAFRLDFRQHRRFAWLVLSRFLFLFGTYAVGRFLLFFVADRMGMSNERAAETTGQLLAVLSLITLLASPLAGWAADRLGRLPLMVFGAAVSGVSVLLLIGASSAIQILAFGSLMAIGSAAFAGANWALTADLAPKDESARFFGLANLGTAGAAAAVGLLGPVVDGANSLWPGSGYPFLFASAAMAFTASALALRGASWPRAAPEGSQI